MSDVCEWRLVPGKKVTYLTECGRTMMRSSTTMEPYEDCPNCDKPVKVAASV